MLADFAVLPGTQREVQAALTQWPKSITSVKCQGAHNVRRAWLSTPIKIISTEPAEIRLLSDHEPHACLNSAIKCTWSILKDVGRLIVRQSPNPGRTISGARTGEHSTF